MFGKGKAQITIPRTSYNPGDTISGEVSLTIKKPVKAVEMSISLIGEQIITRRGTARGSGARQTTTERVRIYDFKQQLDGEREYSQAREYSFV